MMYAVYFLPLSFTLIGFFCLGSLLVAVIEIESLSSLLVVELVGA
jgi:hypothetical protein